MLYEEPTALYRIFGRDRALLYVGISVSWPRRMSQHIADKPWFPCDGAVEFEDYPDRASALAAEAIAIRDEHPAHNIQHNTVRVKVTVEAEVEFSPGGLFAMAAAGSGGLLLAKWAADFLANWWVKRQGDRQGVTVQVPPVLNPFTEDSALLKFFKCMVVATLAAQQRSTDSSQALLASPQQRATDSGNPVMAAYVQMLAQQARRQVSGDGQSVPAS